LSSRTELLVDWFKDHLPQYSVGLTETRAIDPERFDRLGERFLSWASQVLGPDSLDVVARSYANFTTSVNLLQARYEETGHYETDSLAEIHRDLYDQKDRMDRYLWGVYLTFFLWPHHLRLARFFEERFLPRVPVGSRILELAFGPGQWGQSTLLGTEDTRLTGIDIAQSSIDIASALGRVAGLHDRLSYRLGDALKPAEQAEFDVGICGFVMEHLEDPQKLFDALASHLKPGGLCFMTGGLTCAQEDHVYEFRFESEIVLMAEKAGFRLLECASEGPPRTFPKARFLPRSMAVLLQRRRGEFW
jgi:SAM-dependent methyltransferase